MTITERLLELCVKWRTEAATHPYAYNTQHDPEQNFARGKEAAAEELEALIAAISDQGRAARG